MLLLKHIKDFFPTVKFQDFFLLVFFYLPQQKYFLQVSTTIWVNITIGKMETKRF